jgi:hypothetical protein
MAMDHPFDYPKQSTLTMLYFPQLATGATAQFPLERRSNRRTIVNRMPDGTRVKLDDPSAAEIFWSLQYQGLTEGEREALETLFQDTEGRLQTFVFLDPCGNLLTWSEDLSRTVWNKDGALQVGTDAADPFGSQRASRVTNTSQIAQGIEQTVDVPGWYQYCFSFQARAATRTRMTVSISNSNGRIDRVQYSDDNWAVYWCSGQLNGDAGDLTCRVDVDAASAIEVFGFQLDAQPNPSAYRRTYGRSGIYGNARFLEDELRFVATGIDDHSIAMRVFTRQGEQA